MENPGEKSRKCTVWGYDKMASKSVEKRKEGKRNRLSMWEKPECHVRPSGRLPSHRAFGKGRTNVLIKGLGLGDFVSHDPYPLPGQSQLSQK